MQVYTWLVENASAPYARAETYVGFSTPWPSDTIFGGIPVMISDDPTWPADRWAFVEDGTVVSSGYGEPTQRQLPAS